MHAWGSTTNYSSAIADYSLSEVTAVLRDQGNALCPAWLCFTASDYNNRKNQIVFDKSSQSMPNNPSELVKLTLFLPSL